MDVSVDNRIDVESVGTVEVAVGNAADAVVADDHALDITVTKKEYKIVGDEVYIAKLYEDAPQWMKDLVQLVVDNTMETESAMLRNDLIEQLNRFATSYVPLNTYTQSILDLSNADTAMHATLETLNSNFNDGLDTANSQIINLQSTKASKTEVATKVIETLTAQLATPTSELGATIGNLQQTIVDGDSANADSVTTLMSVLEGEVDARATAVNVLNTYVGIDSSGTATGGGLLNSVQALQNQIDGNITTWFYNGVPTLLTAPASGWATAEEKANHVGDIYYDKTSGYGYRFAYEDIVDVPDAGVIYSWIRIVDTDVVKALADAANAQETADGKITTFYQTTAPVAEGIGDIWIDSDNGNKMYRWNGSSWGTDLVGTMVANASAVTALSTELSNGTNTWAAADSQVTNSLTTKIGNDVASVESKWEYNSVVGINGVYKRSGFGLTTNYSGGSGTKADPYTSEFWIDATKLKFTNSATTGRTAPFTIDASGATPQITFNGKVSFSNVTGAPGGGSNLLYNSAPMIANETKGWSVGWSNTGITPTLGAGSDPWRPSGGGSVYAVVPGAPTVGTVFDVAQTTKVPVIGGTWYEASAYTSSHRCTSYVTIAWYDSNNTYITEVGGSQVATAGGGALVNWGRTVLFAQAPANAARAQFYVRSIVNGNDPYCFVAFAYLGKSVVGQTVHSDWSEGTSAGATRTSELTNDAGFTTLGAVASQGYVLPAGVANAINTNTTTIDGSKITTGSITANQIAANSITGNNIVANVAIAAPVINGGVINGGVINGVNITGAVIKASWIDYSSTGHLTNWTYFTPATMPTQYAANFAHNSTDGSLLVDSNGYVRLPKVSKVVVDAYLYKVGSFADVPKFGNFTYNGYDLNIRSYDSYATASTNRLLNSNSRIVFDRAGFTLLGLKGGSGINGRNIGTCSANWRIGTDVFTYYGLSQATNQAADPHTYTTRLTKNGITLMDVTTTIPSGGSTASVTYNQTLTSSGMSVKINAIGANIYVTIPNAINDLVGYSGIDTNISVGVCTGYSSDGVNTGMLCDIPSGAEFY